MSRFKPYRPEQAYLLPPSVKDVLGAGHLCFFVQQVIGQLDLSRFEEQYSAEGGELYAVPLMLSVWLYAYATGLTSARELERRIGEDLPLRYLAGGAQPDHWALSAFRRQHQRGINEVFTQTLELVRDAGLGKLGIVAVDSTSLAAHNSKQRVDTRPGLRQERAKYRRQVRHWQQQCDAAGEPVAAEYAAEQLERVQQRLAVGFVGLDFRHCLRLLGGVTFTVFLSQSHDRNFGETLFELWRTQSAAMRCMTSSGTLRSRRRLRSIQTSGGTSKKTACAS